MSLADFQNLITVAIAFNFAYVFFEKQEDKNSPDSMHPGLWRFFKIFSDSQIRHIRNYTPKRIISLNDFFIGARFAHRSDEKLKYPKAPASFVLLKNRIASINAEATQSIEKLLDLSGMPKLSLLFGLYGLLLLGFSPVYDRCPIAPALIFNLNICCCLVLFWVFIWDVINGCNSHGTLCSFGKVLYRYLPTPRRRYMPLAFALMSLYAFASMHCNTVPFAQFQLPRMWAHHTPVCAVLIVYSVFIIYGFYFIVAYLLIRFNHFCRTRVVMNEYRSDFKDWKRTASMYRVYIVVPNDLEKRKFNSPEPDKTPQKQDGVQQ